MEVLGALLRAAEQMALALIMGGAAFLLFCRSRAPHSLPAPQRLLLPFWLLHLLCAALVFLMRAAQLGDGAGHGLELTQMTAYAWGTHVGRVAMLKLAMASTLGLPLAVASRAGEARQHRIALLAALLIAAIVTALGPLAGHAAADEARRWLLALHMLHLLAVSLWIGGLPFWIAEVFRVQAGRETLAGLRITLSRFSRLAMSCMLLLAASGLAVAWTYIDTQGDLFGTRYGRLLCAKLLLLGAVLLIANRLRRKFLPALAAGSARVRLPWAARWASIELLLATTIVLLAAFLAQSTPANHEPAWWPFSRRVSLAASWLVPGTPLLVMAALAVTALSLLALALLRGQPRWRWPLLLLAVAGGGAALWQLSVPAYPDTYRRSTVPYLTVSIDEGMRHFSEQCTPCHGPGGLGDGALGKTLPRRPANLSEPHTALHTSGDMFWWLTHGIAESGMPGFATQLDEQARWDTINFLRAFSQGFQSRVLDTSVLAGSPWLGAPNFYFEDGSGRERELKDYRESRNVLLVFPPRGEAAQARAQQLADWAPRLRAAGLEILLVSTQAGPLQGLQLLRDDGGEIRRAYDLLSRTIRNRGDGLQLGMQREHMEFLIDRFGYIRARWIPGESAAGWENPAALLPQVQALYREPRILPPPDDHVH